MPGLRYYGLQKKRKKKLLKKREQAECLNKGALSRGLQMLTSYSSGKSFMTSIFSSSAQYQLVGPACSSEIEKAFGAAMGVLARLRFSHGSPLIRVHDGLSLSLTYGFGVGVCLWEWRAFTWRGWGGCLC